MVIKINYTSSDIYVSTNVSPVYVVVNYSGTTSGGAGVWGSITGTLSDQTDLQDALDDKVPYTGATGDVDLGEFGLSAGQLTLDTTPTGTASVGTTRWNDTIGSSETTLKGGSVILKNGVDLVARVVNKVSPNTTLTKANYQAVKISGAQGQRLAVALAQANTDANSADTIGLVCETIATNQEGFIMTVGNLEGINTTGSLQGETWADGDVLYLSPTTAGRLTNIKPNGSTGHIVVIGYVEYAHVNNGKIYVKIMNGWELSELHDTFIDTPLNNQVLTYESATSLWKNKTPTGGGGTTIYSGDGTLSGNRTVNASTYLLKFVSNVNSGLYQSAIFDNIAGTANRVIINHTSNTGTTYSISNVNKFSTTVFDPFGAGNYKFILFNNTIGGASGEAFSIFETTNNFVIGSQSDTGERLQVNGTARVSGGLTISGGSFVANSLYYSATYGMVVAGGVGSSADLLLTDRVGNLRFQIVNGGDIVQTKSVIGGVGIGTATGTIRIYNDTTYGLVYIGNTTASTFSVSIFGDSGTNGLFLKNDGLVKIGAFNSTYNSSAVLEAVSTTKGFLPPRGTNTQMLAIASPVAGLMFYDTTNNKLNCYDGTTWQACW